MLNEKIISAIIEQVLLEVCLNYRNSIPRKAFINACKTIKSRLIDACESELKDIQK